MHRAIRHALSHVFVHRGRTAGAGHQMRLTPTSPAAASGSVRWEATAPLTIALRNPGKYRSVSAFAPIVAPSLVPWGQGLAALSRRGSRPVEPARQRRVGRNGHRFDGTLLIDQGDADSFLEKQLKPELLRDACQQSGQPLNLRIRSDATTATGSASDLHCRSPSSSRSGASRLSGSARRNPHGDVGVKDDFIGSIPDHHIRVQFPSARTIGNRIHPRSCGQDAQRLLEIAHAHALEESIAWNLEW